MQNCGQSLCIADINAAFQEDPLMQREFVERSLRHFLAKTTAFANCPIPDCSGIIPKAVTEDDGDYAEDSRLMRHCEVCHNIVCRRCLKKWHAGKDCDGKENTAQLEVCEQPNADPTSFKHSPSPLTCFCSEMDARGSGEPQDVS